MNNKGLSLVEVIIVVCIMTVLTAMVSIGVGSAMTKPADECAEKIVSSINGARVSAMGKKSYDVVIKQDSSGAEIFIELNGNSKKIGRKGITITCTKKKKDGTGVTSFDLSTKKTITLSFDRSTGGFKPVKVGTDPAEADVFLTEIVVSMGSRSKTIQLIPITGKVKID